MTSFYQAFGKKFFQFFYWTLPLKLEELALRETGMAKFVQNSTFKKMDCLRYIFQNNLSLRGRLRTTSLSEFPLIYVVIVVI